MKITKSQLKRIIKEEIDATMLEEGMVGDLWDKFKGTGFARTFGAVDKTAKAYLEELQEKFNLTYLFIAHDLSVVRHISDRVAVMYLGHIVEIANHNELYENPLHPYTKALLSAIPIPDPVVEATRKYTVLEGEVPSPMNPPQGCVFHTRCPMAIEECKEEIPELRQVAKDHWVACIRTEGYAHNA